MRGGKQPKLARGGPTIDPRGTRYHGAREAVNTAGALFLLCPRGFLLMIALLGTAPLLL